MPNWLRAAFSGIDEQCAKYIDSEPHTIQYHESINAYGFYTNESVKLDITEGPAIRIGSRWLIEIPRSLRPRHGEFRVDYFDEGYYDTGFIECHKDEYGNQCLLSYIGLGVNFMSRIHGELSATTNGYNANRICKYCRSIQRQGCQCIQCGAPHISE